MKLLLDLESTTMNNMTELQRLEATGHGQQHPIPGFCDVVFVKCTIPAEEVLERVQSVLRPVFEHSDNESLSINQWQAFLPNWFVAQFEHPSIDNQAIVGNWDLAGWLYWYLPSSRQWWWWDAKVTSEDEMEITIDRLGEPAVWGDLQLLLLFSGAESAEIG